MNSNEIPKTKRDGKRIEIPISGMSCASCAITIEKGLSNLEGVQEASVNFATEKAAVNYDPIKIDSNKLVDTIKDLGYQARLEKATIPVQGMTCASCVQKVENALNSVDGVVSASVNFATEQATVEYLSPQVSIADLDRAITDAGYTPLPVIEEGEAQDAETKW